MSNVLVYSGPGVSASALSHTLRTLRKLLPSYDVQCINAQSLALDPWMDSTALFVLPGGRDLPYVEKLSENHAAQGVASSSQRSAARADEKIRQFVKQVGGSFVGICAGAYYASSSCEFELGDPVMQVAGPRDALKFFPGTCRGTTYPGFVYESDQGARLVDIAMAEDSWTVYYNGGGAFIDADRFTHNGAVQVLGRYMDESSANFAGTDNSERSIKPGYAGQAAVVRCSIGKGNVILYGVHPEFPVNAQSTPTRANAAPETVPTADVLAKLEAIRLHRFGLHLQTLGLEVLLPASATQQEVADESQPHLSPIVMTSKYGRDALGAVLDRLQPSAASNINSLAKLEMSTQQGRLISIADSNDTVHIYDAGAGPALIDVCAKADYSHYRTPVVAPTSDEARAAPLDAAELEVDLQRVPKYVVLVDPTDKTTDPRLLPHWNIDRFYGSLDRSRSALENDCADDWASYRASDAFNNTPSTLSSLADVHTYGHVVTSTQTMLDKNYRLLTKLPGGFTSFATHQVSGRGRGKNAWISPLGCLQFSTLLPVPTPQQTFWHAGMGAIVFVQYLAGLAIVESIRSGALGEQYAQALGDKLRIKWPNDVYAHVPETSYPKHPQQAPRKGTFVWHGRRYAKMAGVLVNSQFAGSDLVLVVGCGINTLNSRPTTSLSDLIETHNAGIHDKSLALPVVSQEQFAGAILATFERMWNVFLQAGGSFQPFVDSYRRAWLHSDQDTLLQDTEPPTRARIVGITSDFGLLRCVPLPGDGQSVHHVPDSHDPRAWASSMTPGSWIDLQPDGNSFDMLQNLIRRKE
jgi:biotin--protein ligase